MPSASSVPRASIVVPTRSRLDYLEVALASILPQANAAEADVIVVDDAGPSEAARALVERLGARYEPHACPMGLNVARNTGVERSTGELLVFVDDDVEVSPGWLPALLDAAEHNPRVEVFTGPIRPHLEGSPPRSCGREGAPITSLDLGPRDTPARYAWGANMAIRRSALRRVGPFDVTLEHGGDEQEWQERLLAQPGAVARTGTPTILYVADAALDHRRTPADARPRALRHAARARGRAARRFDAWRGQAPSIPRELFTLAACAGHVIRYRCPAGLTMVAHSTGRLREALRHRASQPRTTRPAAEAARVAESAAHSTAAGNATPVATAVSTLLARAENGRASEDFLSGESGTVGGLDGLRRAAADTTLDALLLASGRRPRLDRAARRSPPTRRVLVLGIARPEHRGLAARIRAELERSRHEVQVCVSAPEGRGKFQNLNVLLEEHPPEDRDWLLVVDDDIELPTGFLDRFLFLAERYALDLAQPAHRLASHAAWRVTRRRALSVLRETRFVEIGPLTAFARSTFSTLLPFPDLRMGWGLDLHWAALARAHDLRCGIVDATPIAHRAAPAASAYSREQAVAEARTFLADRPYVRASEAQQTLATHRRW
ncbi:MAG TPA: glycosyltransferase family 2 protein [Solirubrobacteraceae bacterium]|jgi:GT2 family glycosyltransferase